MNVGNAAEDSPNLRHLDVLVPPLRENTVGAVFMWRPLPLLNFTAWADARSQYGDDEAGEGVVAQEDHMSADHLTRSATASEF